MSAPKNFGSNQHAVAVIIPAKKSNKLNTRNPVTMKRTCLSMLAVLAALQFSYAQNNTFPTTGNAGVGTTSPLHKLHVKAANSASAFLVEAAAGGYANVDVLSDRTVGNAGGFRARRSGDTNPYFEINPQADRSAVFFNFGDGTTFAAPKVAFTSTGSVGIGTITPQAKLHVIGNGINANTTAQYSGNLIVEGTSGGRSATSGASLEFVIPANTDGSNPWGQGRITTVAGNTSTTDATGKMILGTRRMFDKGAGYNWNYGDDIVIDGSGNVGINTKNPDQKLSVNGTVHAKKVLVDLNGWADYVLKPDYKLPKLSEVKSYIEQNEHLPEVPSEKELEKTGVDVTEMLKLQMKKIEELTLYLIEKDKQIAQQKLKENQQDDRIKALEQLFIQLNANKNK